MAVSNIRCIVCSEVVEVVYKKTIPKTCFKHTSRYGTARCTSCGQRFVKQYGSEVKCANCKIRRVRKEQKVKLTSCATCSAPFKGKTTQKYCTFDHNPADMDATEMRELYTQFPEGRVWQVPKYRAVVQHLINRKRP